MPVGEAEPMTEAMNRIADDRKFCDSISAEGRKLREQNRVEQIADRFLEERAKKTKHVSGAYN